MDRLLNMDGTCSTISAGVTSSLLPETSQRPHVEARESSNSADHIAKSMLSIHLWLIALLPELLKRGKTAFCN